MPTTRTLGICGVRYSGRYIDTVRVVDDEKAAGPALELPRQAVLDAMQEGANVETFGKGVGEVWDRWGGVTLIAVGGLAFIKMVDDGNALDDLGDLPEY